jgi:hypothetical protein
MLYKFSRVQLRNEKSKEGIFDGKTGYVEEVHMVLDLPNFIIKWDKEKFKDPTPYEMKDLKDLTYDPKHNWHQNEKNNGKVYVAARQFGDGDRNIDKLIEKCMSEKQVLRNVERSTKIAQVRTQRPIVLQEVNIDNSHVQALAPGEATIACADASEFAPNNLTEENRRKNLNYDARTYEVSLFS